MASKILIITSTVLLVLIANAKASGQSMEDALRFSSPNASTSPREAALGISFFGLSDDAASLTKNPAGLTLIPDAELAIGANLTSHSASSLFLGSQKTDVSNEFYFSNVQFILPTLNSENSLFNYKFGFSYSTENDFTLNTNYGGFNTQNSFIAQQARNRAGWVVETELSDSNFNTVLQNNLQQDGFVYEDGGLQNISFGGGMDINEKISLGAVLTLKFGTYEYIRNYFETDKDNLYNVYPDDFYQLTVRDFLTQEVFGITGVMSMQARLNQFCRLGLAVKFPTMLGISETFSSDYNAVYDPNPTAVATEVPAETGILSQEYSIVTPWEFTLGLSGNVAGLSYSVAASMQNTPSIYFDLDAVDLYYEDLLFFDMLNEQIENELTSQYKVGIGLEYKVPMAPLYVRGSYSLETSPYKNDILGEDLHKIGAGLGVMLSNSFIVDIAFNYFTCDYQRANYGSMDMPQYFSSYKLTHSATSFLLGFKYRF